MLKKSTFSSNILCKKSSIKFHLIFAVKSQLWSLPMSICSLVMASTKLYYYQRLGIFSDPDPCLKMTFSTMPLNAILMLGPLFTLILITACIRIYVLVLVFAAIMLNFIVLKLLYYQREQGKEIMKNFCSKDKEQDRKDVDCIFYQSVFTSWISPCTVWAKNKLMVSHFLLCSAFTTLAIYIITLLGFYFFIEKFEFNAMDNPPVFACFPETLVSNLTDKFTFHFSGNTSNSLFNLFSIESDFKPKIRICAANELPTDFLLNPIIYIGLGLNVLSFFGAIGLHFKGDFSINKTKCQKMVFRLVIEKLLTYSLKEQQTSYLYKKNISDLTDALKGYLNNRKYKRSVENALNQMKMTFRNDKSKTN
jgi:hypothetical protein